MQNKAKAFASFVDSTYDRVGGFLVDKQTRLNNIEITIVHSTGNEERLGEEYKMEYLKGRSAYAMYQKNSNKN